MTDALVKQVLDRYGITDAQVLPSQTGYRNEVHPIVLSDGQTIQLTFFKPEPDSLRTINRADAVSQYVTAHGLPARQRYDHRLTHLRSSSRSIYAGLYSYLPGRTIAWDAYTKDHIKLLGKTMSDLHDILSKTSFNDMVSVTDHNKELLARMSAYFERQTVVDALGQKLDLSIVLGARYGQVMGLLSRSAYDQQLHMDFVRGNILFSPASESDPAQLDGLAICGIIDFEKTAIGHPVFDIARTLAFLLVDCKYKTPQKITKYFIDSGYQKRGRQNAPDLEKYLDILVEFYLIHDFYKLLLHTPYEALPHNEHFIRTRDILVERSVLHYL